MDDEHYIDGDHNGGVFNHFNHNSYGYCYQSPVVLVDPNGKQTYFTYTLDYKIHHVTGWKQYIPIMNHPEIEIMDTGTISNYSDNGKPGFEITLRVPKVSVHNLENPEYDVYKGTGTSIDDITWTNEKSLGDAFKDGFNTGWKVAALQNVAISGLVSLGKKVIGVPNNWTIDRSDKGGGIRFIDPKNKQNEIRIMPGNKNSRNPCQQKPYIKYRRNGAYYDKNGRMIKSEEGGARSEAAHIDIKDFDLNKMPKFE